ncbi:MAG: hypothetical protein ACPLPS_09215 [bacterium]
MEKEKLIDKAHKLVRGCSRREVAQQLKPALSYLIYHRDLEKFKKLLETEAASSRSKRHWEEAREKLIPLSESYSVEELLYLIGVAIRLIGYYHR